MAMQAEPIELVKSRIEEVDPQSANEEIERGDAVLIDTREPHEWDVGPSRRAPRLVPPGLGGASGSRSRPGTVQAPAAVLREAATARRAPQTCRTSSATRT